MNELRAIAYWAARTWWNLVYAVTGGDRRAARRARLERGPRYTGVHNPDEPSWYDRKEEAG